MKALTLTPELSDLNREYTEVLVTARILRHIGLPFPSVIDDELDRLYQACTSARESYLDDAAGTNRQLRAELDTRLMDALLCHRREVMHEHCVSLLGDPDGSAA
jgi:hypothetical protein